MSIFRRREGGAAGSLTGLVLKVVQYLQQKFFFGKEECVEGFLVPKSVPLVSVTETGADKGIMAS